MTNKSGFVLLMVMILMSVMASLMAAHFKLVQLALRQQHLLRQFQERDMQLEDVAERLSRRIRPVFAVRLQRSETISLEGIALREFLLQHGAYYAKNYRYATTDLGNYPCIKIMGATTQSTHHWLLNVIDERLPTRVIQMRMISAVPDELCRHEPVMYVFSGRMTWRSMNVYPTKLKIN
jgi:type II secretory pathway component PulJ